MKELLVLSGVVTVDQLSKWYMVGQGRAVVNQGGVWGLLPGFWWVVVVTGLWLTLVGYYLYMRQRGNPSLGLLLIVAAGLGNLLDRVTLGGVRDFIYYPFFQVYGNIADIILAFGLGLILVNRRV